MRKDKQALLSRIHHLKKKLQETPKPDNLSDAVQHILSTAPQALNNLEQQLAMSSGNPQDLEQVYAVISKMESYLTWATGEAGGREMAKNIASGKTPNPNIPVEERLNERIATFLYKHIDKEVYASLVSEWEGNDAVQGDTIHMNPKYLEAFSQWMIHDKTLPKLSKTVITLFAEQHLQQLLQDEQLLLQRQLQDRPSIYQVIQIEPKSGKYTVRNFLNNEQLKIRDNASSKTLNKGAMFIGRAIPNTPNTATYFNFLGAIITVPKELWSDFALFLGDLWNNSKENPTTFFRRHHAEFRQWFYQKTGN